jgi:hypothetical protein
VGPAEHSIELDTKQLTPQTTEIPTCLCQVTYLFPKMQ